MARLHDAASYFIELGLSVIQLRPGDKRPAGKWEHAQTRRTSVDELSTWPADANLGIVCGAISGLVVVDCESRDDAAWFYQNRGRSPVIVQTRRGYHLYFRHPGEPTRNGVRLEGRYDIRADGGYVVGPPSTIGEHRYRFLDGHGLRSVAELPPFQMAWLPRTTPSSSSSRPQADTAAIRDGIRYIAKIHAISGNGGHNATFRAVNKLRDSGLDELEAFVAMQEWNKTNADPPWTNSQLLHKIRDVYHKSAAPGR